MGVWDWVSSGASSVVSVGKSSLKFVGQTAKGFFSYFSPTLFVTAAEPTRTGEAARVAISANMLFTAAAFIEGAAVSALAYEARKRIVAQYIPVLDNPVGDFVIKGAELGVSYLGLYLITRWAIPYYVDTNLNSIALAKEAYDDTKPDKRLAPICKHKGFAQFTASLGSPLYFLGNLGMVTVLEWGADRYVPVLGSKIVYPLTALLYGYSVLEGRLGNMGACTDCRYQILSANNAYALGTGSAIVAVHETSKYLLYKSLGIDSSFINTAMLYSLFQYGTMSAMYNEKPLPETKGGIDFFLPSRLAMGAWMAWCWEYLRNLKSDSTVPLKVYLLEHAKAIGNYKLVDFVSKFFLEENLRTEDFVTRPSFKRVFDLYEPIIISWLDWLIKIRRDPVQNKIPLVAPYLPKWVLSAEKKAQIDLGFNAQLSEIIDLLIDFINFVHKKNGKKPNKEYNPAFLDEIVKEAAKPASVPIIDTSQSIVKKDLVANPEIFKVAEVTSPASPSSSTALVLVAATEIQPQQPSQKPQPSSVKVVSLDKYTKPAPLNQPQLMAHKEQVKLSTSGIFRRRAGQPIAATSEKLKPSPPH